MLGLKAFHIMFVVAWFAGLFYLPRLFVYHAATDDEPGHARFVVMERRLFVMMTLGALGTIGTGGWLAWSYWWPPPGWLLTKLGLVVVLVVHHLMCWVHLRGFAARANRRSGLYYRVFNEVPTVVLLGAVWLAVTKPMGW